jgi:hypothetical protein
MTFANRRIRLLVSRVSILMLLFAQSLYAAQPCQMPVHEPAMAFSDMQNSDMQSMGCHANGNINACLQQCTADDQSTAQVQIAVAVAPAAAVLTLPVVLDARDKLPDTVIVLARSPDPPPSIRFCSFQI